MIYLGILLASLITGVMVYNHNNNHATPEIRKEIVSTDYVAPIPEPNSVLLMALGGLIVGAAIWRRK